VLRCANPPRSHGLPVGLVAITLTQRFVPESDLDLSSTVSGGGSCA